MSPYSPSLVNAVPLSHTPSPAHQQTSFTMTTPPLRYSPTSASYNHYPSPTQESSPTHPHESQTPRSHTPTPPPDYHPTWIPRAPTPPRYSPTSPSYSPFAPLEYIPSCPSHSSPSSGPVYPPAYHPSWIPRKSLSVSGRSSKKNYPSAREEYTPTQSSVEELPSRSPSSPPPYNPTNVPTVTQTLPEYKPLPTNSRYLSESEDSSLNYVPYSPCYRPTSPCIPTSPSYSPRSSLTQTCLHYFPSYDECSPAGSFHTQSNKTQSHSPASSVDGSAPLSYSPASCVSENHDSSCNSSLDYSLPSSLSNPKYCASSSSYKYSPLSPGYS